MFKTQHNAEGGRPTKTISCPSHILLIFSSEPPRNPRPLNFIFFKCSILQEQFFKNQITLEHRQNIKFFLIEKVLSIKFKFVNGMS